MGVRNKMDINWLGILNTGAEVAKMVSMTNPIANIAVRTIQGVVNKANDGVGNESVMGVVSEMAKSSWNDLTPLKVEFIEDVLVSDLTPAKAEAIKAILGMPDDNIQNALDADIEALFNGEY